MKRALTVLAAAAAGLSVFGAATATAAPIPGITNVQDLINQNQGDPTDGIAQGGVVVNGLRFYDFQYSNSATGTGVTPTPTQVAVETAPGGADTTGLRFSANWDAAGTAGVVSTIRYKVHAENPALPIVQVGAAFDGAVGAPSAGTFAQVTETVRTITGTDLGELGLFNDASGPGTEISSATLNVAPPQVDLDLSKAIRARSAGSGSSSINFVDNTFTVIPEPAGLALLVLAGPLALSRRRSSARG